MDAVAVAKRAAPTALPGPADPPADGAAAGGTDPEGDPGKRTTFFDLLCETINKRYSVPLLGPLFGVCQ